MDRDIEGQGSLPRRLVWFVALWAGGVLTVGAFAWLIRLALS